MQVTSRTSSRREAPVTAGRYGRLSLPDSIANEESCDEAYGSAAFWRAGHLPPGSAKANNSLKRSGWRTANWSLTGCPKEPGSRKAS
jgi:hypothetical protein